MTEQYTADELARAQRMADEIKQVMRRGQLETFRVEATVFDLFRIIGVTGERQGPGGLRELRAYALPAWAQSERGVGLAWLHRLHDGVVPMPRVCRDTRR